MEEVLKHYREALTIFEQLVDLRGKSTSLSNIGSIYYKQEYYKKALEFFEESFIITDKLGDLQNKAIRLWWIGIIHSKMNNKSEAIKSLKHSISIYKQIDLTNMVQEVQTNLDSIVA